MKNEEIYKALQTLRQTCNEYGGSCKKCPMGNDYGECLVRDSYPCNWDLKKPTQVVRIME